MLRTASGLIGRMIVVVVFAGTAQAFADSVFRVTVLDNGNETQSGLATLITDNLLLSSAALVSRGDQWIVYNTETGAELVASLVVSDDREDLAVLRVNGLDGDTVALAAAGAETGRNVYLQTADARRSGAIHSEIENQGAVLIRHTALLRENEFAAPLLNNCDELLGISQNPLGGILRTRLQVTDDFGRVGPLAALKDFLDRNQIEYREASMACPSAEEQLTRAEQEAREREQELDELQLEQERVREEQEELRRQQEQAEQRNEELEQESRERLEELERQEEELAASEEAIREAEEELQELLEQQAQLEQQAREQEEALARAEAQQVAERRRQVYIGAGSGGAVLILLGFMVWMVRRKRRVLRQAEGAIQEEKARVEATQSELRKASAEFPDFLLLGEDQDGREVRLKINGNALVRSEDGQVIGRSARDADYVLDFEHISRRHLHLAISDGKVTVKDMGSVNGSAVNGDVLETGVPHTIENGDELRIGLITFSVRFL